MAIGCTCSDSGTKCGFLFTNEFIGLDSSESVPKFIDLTADDDCYYLDYENGDFYVGNDIYDDCSSDEFWYFDVCVQCSSWISGCLECEYSRFESL